MEKLFYSWDDQLKDTNEICELIEKDDFVPDVIVGISRGGLIPGVMISHKLNIPFKPVHASTRDFPHWENYLPKSKDEKVLIVDECRRSGSYGEGLMSSLYSKLKSNIVVKLHSAEDSFIPLGMAATSTLPDSQSIYNNAIKLYKDD